ncbi:MAG: hypothetical protein AB7G93_09045 [Bdellovibrionales bacterium]
MKSSLFLGCFLFSASAFASGNDAICGAFAKRIADGLFRTTYPNDNMSNYIVNQRAVSLSEDGTVWEIKYEAGTERALTFHVSAYMNAAEGKCDWDNINKNTMGD